jgi:hypothetical protein
MSRDATFSSLTFGVTRGENEKLLIRGDNYGEYFAVIWNTVLSLNEFVEAIKIFLKNSADCQLADHDPRAKDLESPKVIVLRAMQDAVQMTATVTTPATNTVNDLQMGGGGFNLSLDDHFWSDAAARVAELKLDQVYMVKIITNHGHFGYYPKLANDEELGGEAAFMTHLSLREITARLIHESSADNISLEECNAVLGQLLDRFKEDHMTAAFNRT